MGQTSEQGLVSKLRELAGRFAGTATPRGPAVATATGPAEEPQPVDVVREAAHRAGLSDADISACYASQSSYAWCLALLGVTDTPPITPLPSDLVPLLLKLLSLGRLDHGRVRALGLDRLLLKLVAGRLSNVMRAVAEPAGVMLSRHELAEEIAKVREVFRAAARAAEPRAVEEVVSRVRGVAPGVPEELVLKVLTGRESPAEVAEELLRFAGRVGKPVEEERRAEALGGRAAKHAEERLGGRAQAPREG